MQADAGGNHELWTMPAQQSHLWLHNRKLVPLPLPSVPWDNVSMDFAREQSPMQEELPSYPDWDRHAQQLTPHAVHKDHHR